MNTYKTASEMRKAQSEEFGKLGAKFAFGREQGVDMFKEWGLDYDKEEDRAKVVAVGLGGYMLKEEAHKLGEWCKRCAEERKASIDADKTGDGFIYTLLYDGLAGTEYDYTGEASDGIEHAGFTWDDIEKDPRIAHAFKKARKQVMADSNL